MSKYVLSRRASEASEDCPRKKAKQSKLGQIDWRQKAQGQNGQIILLI